MNEISSEAAFNAFRDAGLFEGDPDMIRRVVIDLQAGLPAKFYVERYADPQRFEVGIDAFLKVNTPE